MTLLLLAHAHAADWDQKGDDRRASFGYDAGQGVGLGIILGYPTGFSVAYHPESRIWFDGAVAWAFNKAIHVQADACLTLSEMRSGDIPNAIFPVWVGVGPQIQVGSADVPNVGIRIPFGMGVMVHGTPVEGFLELVPGIGIAPETTGFFEGGIGARFYLPP